MATYILVNADGKIVNRVEWDGVSLWEPPAGLTAIKADARAGDTWNHAFEMLVPNSDLDHLAARAQDAEAEKLAASQEALLAKLESGQAASSDIQAALAAFLRQKA